MAKTQTQIFGENLRRILKEKDMSQHRFAHLIGISGASVNAWCQGESLPRKSTLEKVYQVLNVSQEELMLDKSGIPNLQIPAAYPLSILGTICAGEGVLAEENFDGYFFVDNSIRADYCLRVEGDSMKDANIFHGDIAFIKKCYDVYDGGIYAVVYGENENAVLKKVYRQSDGFVLNPCNPSYKPIFVNDARIVGECIGVYHSL